MEVFGETVGGRKRDVGAWSLCDFERPKALQIEDVRHSLCWVRETMEVQDQNRCQGREDGSSRGNLTWGIRRWRSLSRRMSGSRRSGV
jgi:hypothetical protein